jgi:hypothetical protein
MLTFTYDGTTLQAGGELHGVEVPTHAVLISRTRTVDDEIATAVRAVVHTWALTLLNGGKRCPRPVCPKTGTDYLPSGQSFKRVK